MEVLLASAKTVEFVNPDENIAFSNSRETCFHVD